MPALTAPRPDALEWLPLILVGWTLTGLLAVVSYMSGGL